MIKTQELNNAYRVYSDEQKLIKHIPTNQIHSEYVVKNEPKIENYIEL